MNAIAIPNIQRSLVARIAVAVVAAVITYAVLIAWELGDTLQDFVDALMRRSAIAHPAETIGSYWQWLAIASCGVLIVSLLFRVQWVRLATVVWLLVTAVFAGLSWVTFGPDNVTPFALFVGCGVAYWLQRAPRAA